MHSSAKGIIAEKKFALRCLELEVPVLTPLIDQNGFDYVIKKGDFYAKIQVKSTSNRDKRHPETYRFNVKRGGVGVKYSKGDFDYLVCYIFELDIFYIIPFDCFNAMTIRVNPSKKNCKYDKFKSAWWQLLETR